jgi:hypothetical protein
LGKTPKKIIVFVIDEHGRALTKESMHRLISELLENAMGEPNADAVVFNGSGINNCANLVGQISGVDISEWEMIYLHGSKYPPVLLTHDNKEKLVAMLPDFKGTSAAAIFKVLDDSEAFENFKKEGYER